MILSLLISAAMALPLDRVADSLESWVTAECGADRVEVQRLGLSPTLPGGEGVELHWQGHACQQRPSLRLLVSENGVDVGAYSVRPTLALWVPVPVAAVDVVAGDPIEIVMGSAPLSELRGDPVGEGRFQARSAMRAGEPVTARSARVIPDVNRGSEVVVEVHRGPLVISMAGRLLDDGNFGERVRVRSDANHRTIEGVLSSNGVVLLGE